MPPPQRPPEAVVFDYDGVLLPYWPRALHAIPNILRLLGLEALEEEFDGEAFRHHLQTVSIGRALFEMLPPLCRRNGKPVPSKEAIIDALIEHETRQDKPRPMYHSTDRALQTLKQRCDDVSHPLKFLGLLSNRSYGTALHHLTGAMPHLFAIMNVMQFCRTTPRQRKKERRQAAEARHSCDILIHGRRKPHIHSFVPLIRWMRNRNFLQNRTRFDPFTIFYFGDTLSDYHAVRNVNDWLVRTVIPLRIFFVPTCVGGPIVSAQEWHQHTEPAWWVAGVVEDMTVLPDCIDASINAASSS